MQNQGTSVVKRPYLLIIGLLCQLTSVVAMGFEAYSLNPGSRAMSMAGVFSAQADDASASWYNPAGLAINADYFSIEYSDLSTQLPSGEYGHEGNVKFFVLTHRLKKFLDLPPTSLAVSFQRNAHFLIDIEDFISPLSTQRFGLVDHSYKQFSLQAAQKLTKQLSLGISLDYVWSHIRCLQYEFCVSNSPAGVGPSFGLLLNLPKWVSGDINVGALWRIKTKVKYRNTPDRGIGSIINYYTPARPETRNLGLHWRLPFAHFSMNTNVLVEQVLWQEAIDSRGLINGDGLNYTNWGLSSEILLPLSTKSIGLRLGYKESTPQGENFEKVRLLSSGFGFNLTKNYFVDFAIEQRKVGNVNDYFYSFSISMQP